jgi:hypothetical protein
MTTCQVISDGRYRKYVYWWLHPSLVHLWPVISERSIHTIRVWARIDRYLQLTIISIISECLTGFMLKGGRIFGRVLSMPFNRMGHRYPGRSTIMAAFLEILNLYYLVTCIASFRSFLFLNTVKRQTPRFFNTWNSENGNMFCYFLFKVNALNNRQSTEYRTVTCEILPNCCIRIYSVNQVNWFI